jgi:hypothetical protein
MLVLVADEVGVVIVGGVSDRQALDGQPWYQAAQLVEWLVERSAGPVRGCPGPAARRVGGGS